jgi:hypothetical protein
VRPIAPDAHAQLPPAALRVRVGRAAVVGLLAATVLNLVYLPVVFSVLSSQPNVLYALVALLAFGVALGLGAAGAWLGSGLGLGIGKSLQAMER